MAASTPPQHPLPDAVDLKTFATACGVHRSRISQLFSGGELPPPDGPGSTEQRPSWHVRTVLRYLAANARTDHTPVPQLYPCPSVAWQRATTRIITLNNPIGSPETSTAPFVKRQMQVHVATYTPVPSGLGDARGHERIVHLATVLEPHDASDFAQIMTVTPNELPPRYPQTRDVTGLSWAELLLGHLHQDEALCHSPTGSDADISLVVLPTSAQVPLPGQSLHDGVPPAVHVIDLAMGDHLVEATRQVANPTGVHQATADDVAVSLGHPLPLWPAGFAVPSLLAAWHDQDLPDPQPVDVSVPPYASANHRVMQWTNRRAPAYGSDADSVRAVGTEQWRACLPAELDSELDTPMVADAGWPWMTAARIVAPASPSPAPSEADLMRGVELLASQPGEPYELVSTLTSFYGDPTEWEPVRINLDQTDPRIRQALPVSLVKSEPAQDPDSPGFSWRVATLVHALSEQVGPTLADPYRWPYRPSRIDSIDNAPDALLTADDDWLAYRPPKQLPPDLLTSGDQVVAVWLSRTDDHALVGWLCLDDGTVSPLPLDPTGSDKDNAAELTSVMRQLAADSSTPHPQVETRAPHSMVTVLSSVVPNELTEILTTEFTVLTVT